MTISIKSITTKQELLSRVSAGNLSVGAQASPHSLEVKGLISKEQSADFPTKIYVNYSTGYGTKTVTRYI